jgi:hypothetical protein
MLNSYPEPIRPAAEVLFLGDGDERPHLRWIRVHDRRVS